MNRDASCVSVRVLGGPSEFGPGVGDRTKVLERRERAIHCLAVHLEFGTEF